MMEKLIRNENEAIETIKANMPTSGYQMLRESLEMAVTGLKEVQKYREIGTVEECREAREKMLKSERQKSICRKYSARDKYGYVHCNDCPLVVDQMGHMCRSNSHYDRKLKEWVPDEEE